MDEKLDISTLIVLSAITVYCTHATQQLEASDSNTELALLLIDILNKSDGLENVCKSKSEGENDHGNDDLIERDSSTQGNILFHEHEFLELLEPHSSFSTYIFEQLERLDCVDMFIQFFKDLDSLFYPKIDDDKEEGSDRPVLSDEKEQPDFFLILDKGSLFGTFVRISVLQFNLLDFFGITKCFQRFLSDYQRLKNTMAGYTMTIDTPNKPVHNQQSASKSNTKHFIPENMREHYKNNGYLRQFLDNANERDYEKALHYLHLLYDSSRLITVAPRLAVNLDINANSNYYLHGATNFHSNGADNENENENDRQYSLLNAHESPRVDIFGNYYYFRNNYDSCNRADLFHPLLNGGLSNGNHQSVYSPISASQFDSTMNHYCFALLNIAILNYNFGFYITSFNSLKEAMNVANEQHNHTCLLYIQSFRVRLMSKLASLHTNSSMERLPNQLSSELKEFDIISELDSTCRLAIDENQHHIYVKARLDAISLKISERNNCIRKQNKTLNIVKKGDGVNYDHRVFEELHELKFLIIGYHLEYLFTDLYLVYSRYFKDFRPELAFFYLHMAMRHAAIQLFQQNRNISLNSSINMISLCAEIALRNGESPKHIKALLYNILESISHSDPKTVAKNNIHDQNSYYSSHVDLISSRINNIIFTSTL